MFWKALAGQSSIRSVGDIVERIEQGAVEIKDDGAIRHSDGKFLVLLVGVADHVNDHRAGQNQHGILPLRDVHAVSVG